MNRSLLLCALLLLFAHRACADTIETLASVGTLQSGSVDGNGLFGVAGANLTGVSYTLTYTLDYNAYPALPGGYAYLPSYPTNDYGDQYDTNTTVTPVKAQITVNGRTYSVPAPSDTVVRGAQTGERDVDGIAVDRYIEINTENQGHAYFDYNDYFPLSYTDLIYRTLNGVVLQNSFYLSTGDGNPQDSALDVNTTLNFSAPLTLVSVATTPEPSALLLMLPGALAIAGQARRRFRSRSAV